MRSTRRIGLTTRGSALLTAGLTAAACGVLLGQRDLVRVAILLVAAPLTAAFIVGRARVTIACARSASPARAYGGQPVTISISLTNQSMLPTGALLLEDTLGAPLTGRARFTLDSLRGRETRTLAYRLPPVRRGRYRVGPLQMRVTDPFGLVERNRSFRAVSEFVVLPVVDDLPEGALPTAWDVAEQSGSHSVGAHGSDDASTREYRDGDDLRKVHWRSTARVGQLMVRQEERPWHSRTTVVLDSRAAAHRHADDEVVGDARTRESFEWAVSAVASICTHLATRGREIDLVTEGAPARFLSVGHLLDHLATVDLVEQADLADVAQTVHGVSRDSTVIAVFGSLEETSARMLAQTRRAPGTGLALVLDTQVWGHVRPGTDDLYERRARHAELLLTEAGWRVVRVRDPRESTADAWVRLLARGVLLSDARSPAAASPSGVRL